MPNQGLRVRPAVEPSTDNAVSFFVLVAGDILQVIVSGARWADLESIRVFSELDWADLWLQLLKYDDLECCNYITPPDGLC